MGKTCDGNGVRQQGKLSGRACGTVADTTTLFQFLMRPSMVLFLSLLKSGFKFRKCKVDLVSSSMVVVKGTHMLTVFFSPRVANGAASLATWLQACSIASRNFGFTFAPFVFVPLSGTSKLYPKDFEW